MFGETASELSFQNSHKVFKLWILSLKLKVTVGWPFFHLSLGLYYCLNTDTIPLAIPIQSEYAWTKRGTWTWAFTQSLSIAIFLCRNRIWYNRYLINNIAQCCCIIPGKEWEAGNCHLWNVIVAVFSLVAFGSLVYRAHFLLPQQQWAGAKVPLFSHLTSPWSWTRGAGLFRSYAGATQN